MKVSCFIQIVKKASQHSQLISQTALFIISYMKGGSKKEDIYFEKCFLDRVRQKGITKTLRHCRFALSKIHITQSFFRFVSFQGLGSAVLLLAKDTWRTSCRGGWILHLSLQANCNETADRTHCGSDAFHATAKYASYVLGVASQFCPDVHAAL